MPEVENLYQLRCWLKGKRNIDWVAQENFRKKTVISTIVSSLLFHISFPLPILLFYIQWFTLHSLQFIEYQDRIVREPDDKCTSPKDPGWSSGYNNQSEFEIPLFYTFLFISGIVALYYMEAFVIVKILYEKGYRLILVGQNCGH